MSILSTLNVLLKGDATHFSAAMRKGRSDASQFTRTLQSVGSAATMLKATLGGVAAYLTASKLTGLVTGALNATEETSNLAKRLNVTHNELVTLQHAADKSDVSIETMNESLQKMSVLLGNASFGESGAIDTLKKLGLSIYDLQGKGGDQAFLTIVEAINKIPDPMKRAAAVSDVFGRSARELGNILDLTGDSLAKFRSEAGQIGLLKTDEELASLDAIQERVEGIGRRWEAAKKNLGGAAAVLADETGVLGVIEGGGMALSELAQDIASGNRVGAAADNRPRNDFGALIPQFAPPPEDQRWLPVLSDGLASLDDFGKAIAKGKPVFDAMAAQGGAQVFVDTMLGLAQEAVHDATHMIYGSGRGSPKQGGGAFPSISDPQMAPNVGLLTQADFQWRARIEAARSGDVKQDKQIKVLADIDDGIQELVELGKRQQVVFKEP